MTLLTNRKAFFLGLNYLLIQIVTANYIFNDVLRQKSWEFCLSALLLLLPTQALPHLFLQLYDFNVSLNYYTEDKRAPRVLEPPQRPETKCDIV